MSRIGLAFLALTFAVTAHADRGDIEIARFSEGLNQLNQLYPPGRQNVNAVGERALQAGARGATFNLQGLTRMYKELDKEFKDIGDTIKDLEDAIGEFDHWNEVLKATKGQRISADDKARIEQNITKAHAAYIAMLTDNKWVRPDGGKTFVQKTIEKIEGFKWPKKKDDREFLLDQMDEQVKHVRDTKFDVRVLQAKNGLHELRREIRWFLIEAQATQGLVAFAPGKSCPIPQFANVAEIEKRIEQTSKGDLRFTKMPAPSTEIDACLIPHCLVSGAAFFVAQLGAIKDQAEAELGRTPGRDVVPARLQPSAFQTQNFLLQTNLMEVLHQQLKDCRKN